MNVFGNRIEVSGSIVNEMGQAWARQYATKQGLIAALESATKSRVDVELTAAETNEQTGNITYTVVVRAGVSPNRTA